MIEGAFREVQRGGKEGNWSDPKAEFFGKNELGRGSGSLRRRGRSLSPGEEIWGCRYGEERA